MANNPYVNKVVFGSATLVDLTGTTATADKILSGYGAFGADGAWMDGTASSGGRIWQDTNGYVHLSDDGTLVGVEPLTVTENGTYTAPTGKAYSPVTVNVSGGGVDVNTLKITVINNSSEDIGVSSLIGVFERMYYLSPTDKLTYVSGSGGMFQTISAHTTYEITFVCGTGFKMIEIMLDHGLTSAFSDMVNIYEETQGTSSTECAFDDNRDSASMTITLT